MPSVPHGSKNKKRFSFQTGGALLGAAFLMANSSIGPGFLTQTTVFTQQLMASFGFVILISVLLDVGAQLNTWRVLTMSEMRAQDLANSLIPGMGYFLAALVVLGGFAFNIGNMAGCGLGMNVIFGISFREAAILSGLIALALFWFREIGAMLDRVTKILGCVKIFLTLFITVRAAPPLSDAIQHTFFPSKLSALAIVTIVGGTVGGYITFSGAHRLLDAGIKGKENLQKVNRSALSGIFISCLMRFILFLAAFGVLTHGAVPDKDNPASTVFHFAAGETGLLIFGIVLWSASISSVLGAAYTSVSFMKTLSPAIARNEKLAITLFIVMSDLIFTWLGRPKELLIAAGVVNGFILPLALAVFLLAAASPRLMNGYRHPLWMQLCGWIVVLAMGWMSISALAGLFQ